MLFDVAVERVDGVFQCLHLTVYLFLELARVCGVVCELVREQGQVSAKINSG